MLSHRVPSILMVFVVLGSALWLAGCSSSSSSSCSMACCAPTAAEHDHSTHPATQPTSASTQWKVLFDGKSLDGWTVADYGGHGEVKLQNGMAILGLGDGLTGITYNGPDLPTMNYEVVVEAERLDGSDFFCGLTFPVNKTHASLICGGWGGSLVGISSLEGEDAAHNTTGMVKDFKDKQWYTMRVRVLPAKLQAFIDNEKVVDIETTNREIDVRADIELSKPLGVASWQTKAAVRLVRIRSLTPAEVEAASKEPTL